MKRNKIILLLVVLVSLVGICFPLETMCYLLLYGCGMILVLSLIQAVFLWGKITSSLQIKEGMIKKGQDAVCKIVSTNRSRLLNGWVTMRVSVPLLGKKASKVIQQADAGESTESCVTFMPEYAGIYHVQANMRTVADIFGLVHVPVRKCTPTWFVVRPELHPVTSICLQEMVESRRRLQDPVLSYDVRKYQNGDNMRHIHWKISAKEGELYTRLEESEEKPFIHVYMDAKRIQAKGIKYLEIRDKMIETTLSVIYGWYQAGYRVQISWESEGIKIREVSNEYQWNHVYSEIAQMEFTGTLDMDEWCSYHKTEHCSYIVHAPGFAFFTKMTEGYHVWVIGGFDNGNGGKAVPLFEDIQEL